MKYDNHKPQTLVGEKKIPVNILSPLSDNKISTLPLLSSSRKEQETDIFAPDRINETPTNQPLTVNENLKLGIPMKVYPGATLMDNEKKQSTKIYRFPNYLEFSKITEDEIVYISSIDDISSNTSEDIIKCSCRSIDGQIIESENLSLTNRYLTSKFFERRKIGWNDINITKKSGTVVGYCFNGIIYNINEQEEVKKVVYHTIYLSIVSKKPDFVDLTKFLLSGTGIRLISDNEYFLEAFSEALKAVIELH